MPESTFHLTAFVLSPQTMVMTGEVAIKTRKDAYKQKRVFFVTPQVWIKLGNDPMTE